MNRYKTKTAKIQFEWQHKQFSFSFWEVGSPDHIGGGTIRVRRGEKGRNMTSWLVVDVAVSRVRALVLSSIALVRGVPPLLVTPGRLVSPACGIRSIPMSDLFVCLYRTHKCSHGSFWSVNSCIGERFAPSWLTVIIIHLAARHWAGVSGAVHGVVSCLALGLVLCQHLLLLVSVAVAVGALLIGRGGHRLVAFSLGGAGVGAGHGRAGVVGGAAAALRVKGAAAALGVKGAVADVAAWSAGCRAFGCVVTVKFIYKLKRITAM